MRATATVRMSVRLRVTARLRATARMTVSIRIVFATIRILYLISNHICLTLVDAFTAASKI